jgi:hypothetical protein
MTIVRDIFTGQTAHAFLLFTLGVVVVFAARLPGFYAGAFAGLDTQAWFWLVVANAVVHQLFVWICWRTELYAKGMTRLFGAAAFVLYASIFTILILARPVLVTALAVSNAGTVPLDPALGNLIAFALCVPVIYLGYSVRRFFGFRRAFGIDHFDPAYRSLPMIRGGIFRFSPNAMYVFGFMLLWIPAFYFRSTAAFVAAAFSHVYIWVHYLATEKPDMDYIYGKAGSR